MKSFEPNSKYLFFRILAILPVLVLFLFVNANSQVTVGATNYSTLKAAFDAINAGTHPGNITVLITNNTTETATALLYVSSSVCPSITISPSGGDRKISGNIDGNLVEIQSSNVTIDGSTTSGGTTQNLSITNGNGVVTYNPVSVVVAFGAKVSVKNCNIYNQAKGVGIGIYIYSADQTLVENCNIYRSDRGIFAQGDNTGAYVVTNLTIQKNKIGSSTAADKIRWRAIMLGPAPATSATGTWIAHVRDFKIQDNEILGLANTDYASSMIGIACLLGTTDGYIRRNKIHDMKVSTITGGCYGMYLGFNPNTAIPAAPYVDGNIIVDNNMIYDIETTTSSTIGIVVGYIGKCKFYHNSIYISSSNKSSGAVMCFDANPVPKNCICKNNIFKCTMAGSYATLVYVYDATTPFDTLDYNDYYITSSGTANYGMLAGAGSTTLAAWQTAIGAEKNAQNIEPSFNSATDLHLDGTGFTNSSLLVPNVLSYDFDNETRRTGSGNVTLMGADEVYPTLTYSTDLPATVGPLCAGSNLTITVVPSVTYGDNVSRTASLTYQWYKGGSSISGEITATLRRNPSVAGDAGSYYVITTLGKLTTQSKTAAVTIHTLATITTQPTQYTYVCAGFPITVPPKVVTSGTVLGYQWQKQNVNNTWSDIPGQTSASLNIVVNDASQAQGNYRVIVTGGVCNSSTIISNVTQLVVSTALSNVKLSWPTGFVPGNVCLGDEIRLTATGQGTIAGYQWQQQVSGIWYDIQASQNPTAITATLIMTNANFNQNGLYRCRVFGSANCLTPEIPTAAVQVTVWPQFIVSLQPVSQHICEGSTVSMYIVTQGVAYSYNWQKDGVDIDPMTNPTVKTQLFSFDNANYKSSGSYRCRIDIEDCKGRRNFYTDEALVYVYQPTEFTISPPVSYTKVGGTATFEIKAHVEGTPPKYITDVQWYRGNVKLTETNRIAGTKSSVLSIRDIQASDIGSDYSVVVTGICGTQTLTNIQVTIPSVTIQTQPQPQDLCEGKNATFSVAGTASNGGKTVSYQWFNGTNPITDDARISGSATGDLTINNVTKADETTEIYAVVTVQPGGATLASDKVALTVKQVPVVTNQGNLVVNLVQGEDISLAVTATGTQPFTYQWYQDNNPIAGATAETYSKTGVATTDAGAYKCKVTNECGEATSQDFTVAITFFHATDVTDGMANGLVLMNNEPNPFSDETLIRIYSTENRNVKLSLFDIYGKEIAVLFEGTITAGNNPVKVNPANWELSSGIYYYSLISNGYSVTKPMVLIK